MKKVPRPRIQATISLKAHDIIVDGLATPGGPLYNHSFSRAVDKIILEWEDLQKQLKKTQKQAAKYYNRIQQLETEAAGLRVVTLEEKTH